MSQAPTEHSSLVDWDPMPLYSPEDTDPAPPMTPLLLGPDETSSSSEGEEGGSSDEEEGDAVPTSKQPQSQKQGQHAYLQGAWAVQVNLFTALAGPTCFAMPWAFQEAGLLAGPLGVVMVAVLSYFTVCILISSKRRLMQRASALGTSESNASLYSGLDRSYDPSPLPPLSSSMGLGGLRHLTYAQIASRALGRRASVLIKVATCLSCLGACAAYATFTAGLITQLLPSLAQSTVLLYLLPVFIGLSWIRSFKQMAFFNILGNLSLVLGVVMLLYDGLRVSSSPSPPPPHHGHHVPPPHVPPVLPLVSPSTLLLFFGPTTFLFTIHYCAVPIESEMANPSDFPWLLAAAVFFMAIIDIAVGLAGLMFYGRGELVRDPMGRVLPGCEKPVCDNVLKNIGPGGLKTAMSLLFSVNLLFTYAIMLAPPREYLERWIFKRPRVRRRVSSKALFSHNPISSGGGNGNATTGTTNSTTDAGIQQQGGEVKVPWWSERRSRRWRKNLFRAMLVLFTFGVALGVGEFGMLIAFVGGITDALQGFVLPPLIHRATHWTSLGTIKRRMLLALSFLGISLMLSATYQNGLAFQAIRESQAAQELVLWGHGWGAE